MQDNQPDLLTDELIKENVIPRKKLLPLWIKIFAWIFLVIGAFVPVVLVLGLLGNNVQLALYGLETVEPFSSIGLIISTLFIIKAFTAFGLLTGKDWAIKIGLADAIAGIVLCTLLMLYPIVNSNVAFMLRLELVALIPYLFKLLKIKAPWETTAGI
jgi:hypothetical protein